MSNPKPFKGGTKKRRDNWHGYEDIDFQNWWHQEKQKTGSRDLQSKEEVKKMYNYWCLIGCPKIN